MDTVTGVFDGLTGDLIDLDGSKKKEKKLRDKALKQAEEEKAAAKAEQEKQKKKQRQSTMDFYESMRQGSLGLLAPSEKQTIG